MTTNVKNEHTKRSMTQIGRLFRFVILTIINKYIFTVNFQIIVDLCAASFVFHFARVGGSIDDLGIADSDLTTSSYHLYISGSLQIQGFVVS